MSHILGLSTRPDQTSPTLHDDYIILHSKIFSPMKKKRTIKLRITYIFSNQVKDENNLVVENMSQRLLELPRVPTMPGSFLHNNLDIHLIESCANNYMQLDGVNDQMRRLLKAGSG